MLGRKNYLLIDINVIYSDVASIELNYLVGKFYVGRYMGVAIYEIDLNII